MRSFQIINATATVHACKLIYPKWTNKGKAASNKKIKKEEC